MRQLVRGVQAFLADWARELRLGQTDFQALVRVVASEGMTSAELRRILGITSGSMTELADRLEAAGLVTRVRPQEDRRSVVVKPTATGRRAVERALGPALGSVGDVVSRLASDDLAVIAAFLSEVYEAVDVSRPRARLSP